MYPKIDEEEEEEEEVEEEEEEEEEENIMATKAFHTLLSLKNQYASNNNENDTGTPFCLQKIAMSNIAAALTCHVCGASFERVEDILHHDNTTHLRQVPSQCCFCGEVFLDDLTLSLHKIATPFIRKCENCHENWTPCHVCSSKFLDECIEKRMSYHCPLGCDLRMKFDKKEEIIEHCSQLHGTDPEDIRIDEKKKFIMVELGEQGTECSECGILIKVENISMSHHIIYLCQARGIVQKAFITRLTGYAEAKGMDPDLILKMEFESETSDEKSSKDLISSYISWSEALNDSLKSNLPEKYHSVVSDMYSRLYEDVKWNPLTSSSLLSRINNHSPDMNLVARLEAELNEFDKENRDEALENPLKSTAALHKVRVELENMK